MGLTERIIVLNLATSKMLHLERLLSVASIINTKTRLKNLFHRQAGTSSCCGGSDPSS